MYKGLDISQKAHKLISDKIEEVLEDDDFMSVPRNSLL